MIDGTDGNENPATCALRQGEELAALAYQHAFALAPRLREPMGRVLSRHQHSANHPPEIGNDLPAPNYLPWGDTVHLIRSSIFADAAFALGARLLIAEEQWLKLLHRWLLTRFDPASRAELCDHLLLPQWTNRNEALHAVTVLRSEGGERLRELAPPSDASRRP